MNRQTQNFIRLLLRFRQIHRRLIKFPPDCLLMNRCRVMNFCFDPGIQKKFPQFIAIFGLHDKGVVNSLDPFDSLRNFFTQTGAKNHTSGIIKLNDATYTYFVKCRNSLGNALLIFTCPPFVLSMPPVLLR